MKRFRLNLFLSIFLMLAFTVATTLLYHYGMWPQATLSLLGILSCLLYLLHLIRKLIRISGIFLNALEVNDVTVRFNFGEDDPELRRMSLIMNRIIGIYRRNLREVETAKLYYDRILKVMTHEMRNAITPVIAISSDMADHPQKYDTESIEEAAAVIRLQGVGIKKFLDSYYLLTHVGEPDKKRIAAVTFFMRLRQLSAIEANERGLNEDVVSFTVAKGLELDIDEALITQTLVNLIRNALDSAAVNDQPKVELTACMAADDIKITIADNGSGIDPNIKEFLFQPFCTTKAAGSGVGLALSRQIVRKHGGELHLTDRVPHGATATITLPSIQ